MVNQCGLPKFRKATPPGGPWMAGPRWGLPGGPGKPDLALQGSRLLGRKDRLSGLGLHPNSTAHSLRALHSPINTSL